MLCATSYGELTRFLGILAGNNLDTLSNITGKLPPYFGGRLKVKFLSNFCYNSMWIISIFCRSPHGVKSRCFAGGTLVFYRYLSGFSTSIVLIFCRDFLKRIYSVFFWRFALNNIDVISPISSQIFSKHF